MYGISTQTMLNKSEGPDLYIPELFMKSDMKYTSISNAF